jgi:hypothetical protein
VRRPVLFPLLLAIFCITNVSCKKSDAERAAEERAAARKRLEDSFALVPYRSLKAVVRASRLQPAPPELTAHIAAMNAIGMYGAAHPTAHEAKQLAALAVELYRARATLKAVDEDRFPTLWEVLVQAPRPIAWYDARVEHLGLGVGAWLFDVALKREPIADILFYEIDRAEAQPSWPPVLRIASQASRGLAYMSAKYHYAADEELTGYLAGLSRIDPASKAMLAAGLGSPEHPFTPDQVLAALEAGGYLARAYNRLALDRDDPAADDLEQALTRCERLGVENELTDWGWSWIFVRRKKYDEAGRRLEKLAQSPQLSDEERAEVRAYGKALSEKKGAILFGRQRAQLVLVRAVITRAGGLEKVMTAALGEETATKLYAPLAWMDGLQRGVTDAGAKLGDDARKVGKSGLDFVKEKLGK